MDHLRSSRSRPATNALQRRLVTHTRLGFRRSHGGAANGFVSRDFPIPQPIGLAERGIPAPRQMAEPTTDPRGCIRRSHRFSMSPARPRRGRAHETYIKHPYLLSALGLAYVRELQIDDATTGVAAPTNHFVGYSASEGGLKPPQPIWVRTSFTTCTPRRSKPRSATADCSR